MGEFEMKAKVKQTKARKKAKKKQGEADIDYLLKRIEQEHDKARLKLKDQTNEAFGFYTHFVCCAMHTLYWINGDPATARFPKSFEGQRLAKATAWLNSTINKSDAGEVKAARREQVLALREVWPQYAKECCGMMTKDEIQEMQWEGLVSTHDFEEEEDWQPLPKFAVKSSEDFHLVAMCIIFLNRALSKDLTNLRL